MRISKEYAAALFALATEEKQEARYNEALIFVSEIFSQNPDYIKVLSSPSVSVDERIDMINKAFKNAVPQNVLSFIKLLCKKSYIDLIYECINEYKTLFEEKFGARELKVITASPLSDDEKAALKQSFEGSLGYEVKLQCSVDSDVIGGVIVEVNGKIIDASLSHELKELKDVISK